jgi:hypothetical protein
LSVGYLGLGLDIAGQLRLTQEAEAIIGPPDVVANLRALAEARG